MKTSFAFFFGLLAVQAFSQKFSEQKYYTLVVNPMKENIEMYWKDDQGRTIQTFEDLKAYLKTKGKTLRFATNGGAFMEDYTPLGLYVENGKVLTPLNTREGTTNFYLKPNGVFIITNEGRAFITTTSGYTHFSSEARYANQTGTKIVSLGGIGYYASLMNTTKCIRNAVGKISREKIVFVLSKIPVTMKELAEYCVELGCDDALYLDGNVSDFYFPEGNLFGNGRDFGVIFAVTR
jgi:uncharacterized protein YigE (DUF2233 family)